MNVDFIYNPLPPSVYPNSFVKLSKIPLVLEDKYSFFLSFPRHYFTVILFYLPTYKQCVNSKADLHSLPSPFIQQLVTCDSISNAEVSLKFLGQTEVQREVFCLGSPGRNYPSGMSMFSCHAASWCTGKWKFLAIAVLSVYTFFFFLPLRFFCRLKFPDF